MAGSCKIHFCCICSVIFVKCRQSNPYTLKNVYNRIQRDQVLWNFRFSQRRVWRWLSCQMLRHVVWWKFTDSSEVLVASIIWGMEASETSVNFYQITRRNIPEDNSDLSISCFREISVQYIWAYTLLDTETLQTSTGCIQEQLTNLCCTCRLPSCFVSLLCFNVVN
jgi:hypothetical protein